MVTSSELQYAYNKFYIQMRLYIWDFEVVESLVDLEMNIYKAIPSILDIKKSLKSLKRLIWNTVKEDETGDFKRSFEKLENLVEEESSTYYSIKKVQEVHTS